jgi:uncharacterized OsmC-like protein
MTAAQTTAGPAHGADVDSPVGDVNGVALHAVAALSDTVRSAPDACATTWRADVTWAGGLRSTSHVRGFAPVASDEPPALGGSDTAPNPIEQLLAALGNCLAVGYVANATADGITLHALRIELTGELDLGAFLGLRPGHAGFDTIRATVHLDTDTDPADEQRLHQAVVGSSPVAHTLQTAIPVAIELPDGSTV